MMTRVGSFEAFYEEAHPRVRAALTVIVGDADAAADATDEAFARAYLHWHRVAAMEAPQAWVVKVGLNVARRRGRRRAMERTLLRRIPTPAVLPAQAGEVWLLVADLPPRQRTAIVLRYVADLTEAQIAAAMGVTRGTVSATLAAAKSRLASALADPNEEES